MTERPMIAEMNDVLVEASEARPAPPVVVVQYRTRGLPWAVVIPLLLLVPAGAVSVYHNAIIDSGRGRPSQSTAARSQVALPASAPAGATATREITSKSASPAGSNPPGELVGPLSLNTQPIAPAALEREMAAPAKPKLVPLLPEPLKPKTTPAVVVTSPPPAPAPPRELARPSIPDTVPPPPASLVEFGYPTDDPGRRLDPPVDARGEKRTLPVGFSLPRQERPTVPLPLTVSPPKPSSQ